MNSKYIDNAKKEIEKIQGWKIYYKIHEIDRIDMMLLEIIKELRGLRKCVSKKKRA